MPDHNLTSGDDPPATRDRRAQLTAAGWAIRSWVHARRATWSAPETPMAARVAEARAAAVPLTTPAPPQQTAYRPAEAPVMPAPPEEVAFPFAEGARLEPGEPLMEAPAAAVDSRRSPIPARTAAWVRSARGPLLRWALQAGAAAALLVILIYGGSAARSYWTRLRTTMTMGTAVFESAPPGSEVIVNGAVLGTTPFTAELAAGHHVVEFRYRKAVRTLELDVTAGQSTIGHLDWTAKPTGGLQVRSDPAGAQVLIDGRARGVTPLTIDDLTVGSHVLVLESDKGSVRRNVTIAADRTAQVSESIYPGWLRLLSPVDLVITEGTRTIRLDERNQVMLPPGSHALRLENRALGYREERQVEVKPGETTSVSIVPPASAITVNASQPSEVSIDGEPVGAVPITDRPIALGTHQVIVRGAAGERRFVITVTVAPVRLDVDFSRP